MRRIALLALALTALATAHLKAQPSAPGSPVELSTPAVKAPPLRLLSESELPFFEDSFKSKAGLVKAAKKTLAYLEKRKGPRYIRIGERDYAPAALADSVTELLRILKSSATADELNARILESFDVFQSVGSDGAGKVVFSSYYQPTLAASLKKSSNYPYPLYRRPSDMVEADLGAFDKKFGDDVLIGRVDKDRRLVPYFARADIDIRKALKGKGLEIACLQNKFDALDLHIQGSGILRFPSGKEVLAKYAATNARPYNSVGMLLVKANVLGKDEVTHEKVRQYLRAHPEAEDWILAQNPRYTFFELAPLPPDGEPFGTINESLVAARSIAIDPAVIPLGAVAYFETTSPQVDPDGRLLGQFPNSRFALCMDTGGAIKGPGRVDIYAGHGMQADTTAKNQWNEGRLYILVKKIPPRER